MFSNSYLWKEGLEKGNIRSTNRIKFLAAGLDNYADISINKALKAISSNIYLKKIKCLKIVPNQILSLL